MPRIAKASLLLFFFSLCGVASVVTHHLRQRAPAPAPRELFAVVNDQLTALRAADFTGAYRYAANGVQQKFTLSQFENMVRHSYSDMTRADHVEFGSVRVEGETAFVHVFFFAADGSVRSFLYNLIAEDNSWKISGVEEISVQPLRVPLAGLHV
jgi:uncharacterized protein DUF4864